MLRMVSISVGLLFHYDDYMKFIQFNDRMLNLFLNHSMRLVNYQNDTC